MHRKCLGKKQTRPVNRCYTRSTICIVVLVCLCSGRIPVPTCSYTAWHMLRRTQYRVRCVFETVLLASACFRLSAMCDVVGQCTKPNASQYRVAHFGRRVTLKEAAISLTSLGLENLNARLTLMLVLGRDFNRRFAKRKSEHGNRNELMLQDVGLVLSQLIAQAYSSVLRIAQT